MVEGVGNGYRLEDMPRHFSSRFVGRRGHFPRKKVTRSGQKNSVETPIPCDENHPTSCEANDLSIDEVVTDSPQRISDVAPNRPVTFREEYPDFDGSEDREEDDMSVAVSWLVRNGILELDRGEDFLVFVTIGRTSKGALKPSGVCTLLFRGNGMPMSYCSRTGCEGQEWHAEFLVKEDEGTLCKCAEVLLDVYPNAFRGDGENVSKRLEKVCYESENERCPIDAEFDEVDTENQISNVRHVNVSSNSIRFTLEEEGRVYYAVCCKDIFQSHKWGLIGMYGGQPICITCRRNTSCCKHVSTLGGSRILYDADPSLQEEGSKKVKESINNTLLVETIALKRAQQNFLTGTNDENPAEFFKMKQVLSSIGLDKHNDSNMLNLDEVYGKECKFICTICGSNEFYALEHNVQLYTDMGLFTISAARLCTSCYIDSRVPAICFVPYVAVNQIIKVHDCAFLANELIGNWYNLGETKHSYTSLCIALLKKVLYHSSTSVVKQRTFKQLLQHLKRPFREGMQFLVLSLNLTAFRPTKCNCGSTCGLSTIHVDGMVLGFKKDKAAFERPWNEFKESTVVIPYNKNYPPTHVRKVLWDLGSQGIKLCDVDDAKANLKGPLKILRDHIVKSRNGRLAVVPALSGLCQALGSIYPLNTLIPPCSRRILQTFCDREIEVFGRDEIKELFRESRHLGMAILHLTRRTRSQKKILLLCHYMVQRLAISSTFKELKELDATDAREDDGCGTKYERMGSLEFALRTGCLGPKGAFVRYSRSYSKCSIVRKEKEYKKSNEMVPGVIHYLCGGCSQVVGFHVIHGRDSESTVDIMEFLYCFFQEPPKKIVYDNAKELQLVCALREPEFFKDTIFLQDQAHHRNHTSAPTHFCTSNDRAITNGPLSEQHNADVRNQQNSMLFSNQVGYMILMCAQAMLWNSKKKRTGACNGNESNNGL